MDPFEEHYFDGDGEYDESSYPCPIGRVVPKKETEKALLVMTEDLDDVWIPKSVIHEDSEVWNMKSEPGTMVVKLWWADKYGLV
jgi:hypothetical protein